MEFDKKHQFLIREFGEDVISQRYATWLNEIQKIVNCLGGGDFFYIDEDNVALAVLDYFTDVIRLKPFHHIKHINVQKIYGYSMFWLLKNKPVQTVAAVPDSLRYINERTVLFMFVPKMLAEIGLHPNTAAQSEVFVNFLNLLYYNLRYRQSNSQSLELMVDAFISGYRLPH
ncbi:MAG: hypothetical protein LBR85_07855 [Oscillospiraceae bacterium]|jgi:hypothetical protein|nr:hypothetical protein [Oscillospiraceae bacterium]